MAALLKKCSIVPFLTEGFASSLSEETFEVSSESSEDDIFAQIWLGAQRYFSHASLERFARFQNYYELYGEALDKRAFKIDLTLVG